jgi:hypothetical protein
LSFFPSPFAPERNTEISAAVAFNNRQAQNRVMKSEGLFFMVMNRLYLPKGHILF